MEQRKTDHINLALETQTSGIEKDARFDYEPMLSGHPGNHMPRVDIGGKMLQAPLWISSMTGGTEGARTINHNLARLAREFGLGMGLGSCHVLLRNEKHLPDFDLRGIIGDDRPFYANMGIAQIEQYVTKGKLQTVNDLLALLKADGLVVHVNPLQEWLQPEGDRIQHPPIETIRELVGQSDFPVIVKEVGQGMGLESLRALLELPLAAVEFGAFGGTNFAKLELMRHEQAQKGLLQPLTFIGQTARDMTQHVNQLVDEHATIKTRSLIISGGIKNFLDGYHLTRKSKLPAAYGMASTFLKYAKKDYESLREFTLGQLEGLKIAYAFLRVL
jgi:isopentenyl-diphosphate delta-isomerase